MKKLLAILKLGVILVVLGYASYGTTQWGGSCGYNQLEYEFIFKDLSGQPIEGIELRVEDPRGKEFFCFPVTDYLPDKTPKSDRDGVMRFHHVSTGVEWDNYGWSLFWVYPIQTTRSPQYICRFLHGGIEVHRVLYGKLPNWDWPGQMWQQVPKVKRSWNWSAMIPNEIRYGEEDTVESYSSRLKLFFHDDSSDGPNREVAVACRNTRRQVYKVERARADKEEAIEDYDFPVIRRTITVEVPRDGR
jgi:hypothetical protein